jgi:hypothetical protein
MGAKTRRAEQLGAKILDRTANLRTPNLAGDLLEDAHAS